MPNSSGQACALCHLTSDGSKVNSHATGQRGLGLLRCVVGERNRYRLTLSVSLGGGEATLKNIRRLTWANCFSAALPVAAVRAQSVAKPAMCTGCMIGTSRFGDPDRHLEVGFL